MKNIYNILEKFGITIPEGKKEEFDKLVAENYKTVAELEVVKNNLTNVTTERDTYKEKYDKDIKQRDDDLAKLQKQLKEAGDNSEQLETVQQELENLKTSYAEDKKNYEAQLSKQKYEFAVKEKVNTLQFTSNAAKKNFIADVIATGLKMDGDTLLGFDDYVAKYKEEDAGAFLTDDSGDDEGNKKPKPKFSDKSGKTDSDGKGDDGKGDDKPKERPLIW